MIAFSVITAFKQTQTVYTNCFKLCLFLLQLHCSCVALVLFNFDNDVRLSFAECISRMIAGYRDYLFYLNDEMPVFNKLDFMRDRILHNRRRLADSIPRKIRLGRTRAEDEIDIERSKRFLSTLFETQSFGKRRERASRIWKPCSYRHSDFL